MLAAAQPRKRGRPRFAAQQRSLDKVRTAKAGGCMCAVWAQGGRKVGRQVGTFDHFARSPRRFWASHCHCRTRKNGGSVVGLTALKKAG